MIDREMFAKTMGIFADRLGRALSPITSDAYYDVLSAALSTEEFARGARIVFQAHQYNTWPAPQLFIDAAKPQPKTGLAAAEAFERVLELMGDSRKEPWQRQEDVARLGPIVARAYRAAGGIREFVNVPLENVKWLRRTFVEACELASSEEAQRATIVASTPQESVQDLVAGVARALPDVNRRRLAPPPEARV